MSNKEEVNYQSYFDYYFEDAFFDAILQYGIIKGSNKILFIKPGLDGSLVGYKDKYYNMAI